MDVVVIPKFKVGDRVDIKSVEEMRQTQFGRTLTEQVGSDYMQFYGQSAIITDVNVDEDEKAPKLKIEYWIDIDAGESIWFESEFSDLKEKLEML